MWNLIQSSFNQAWQELKVNRLRTALSLSGITIGIFCIIAVMTVLDGLQNNIRKEVSSLGSDVMYIGRWPWMDEGGEYKWWEYFRRPSMTQKELKAVESKVAQVEVASLMLRFQSTVKHEDLETESIMILGVTEGYDKLQVLDFSDGRFLSVSELVGGNAVCILGRDVYETVFQNGVNPIGKKVTIKGKTFFVAGLLAPSGTNSSGINYDQSIIVPYGSLLSLMDVTSFSNDPTLMVKARPGIPLEEVKLEVEGVLRQVRKVPPGEPDNFSINSLSQIAERMDQLFSMINMIAALIGGFSLIVGGFGIANIMFVSVKERTKMIGLKKAIGAKSGRVLLEFLIEAVMLCLIGGLIGIVIVFGLSLLLTNFADFPVTLSLKNFSIGLGISAVIGLCSGYIPAYNASKLNPVVAIRTT